MRRGQLASRLFTGSLLVVASVYKIADLEWFSEALAAYRLVPSRVARPTAASVAGLELLVGSALLSNRLAPLAAPAAALLFIMFTLAIATNLARGRFDIQCGCVGPWQKQTIGWALVSRNLGLAGLAALSGQTLPNDSILPWGLLFALFLILISAPFLLQIVRRSSGCPEVAH